MFAARQPLTPLERTRRAALAARGRGHVAQPMPAQLPPSRIEDVYAHRLRSHVRRAIATAYAPLLRALPDLVARARAVRGDSSLRLDETGRGASALVRAAHRDMARALRLVAAGEAKGAAADVDAHNRVQLGKQVHASLGIGLAGDARLQPIVAGFVHENVKLIGSIAARLHGEVEGLVLKAITTGQLHEDLARVLRERFEIAEGRAEAIAIDQVGKLNGQLNVQRSKDLGVTHGWWRSSEDERVRGNPSGLYPKAIPSHYARNGLYFAIADPPKGKNGEPELPGVPVRCRCGFEPDLRAVLGGDPTHADPATAPVDVDAEEAEAERLRREVEAMLAGRPLVAPEPSLRPPPPTTPEPKGQPATAPTPSTPVPLVALPPAPPSTETMIERERRKAEALAAVDWSLNRWKQSSPEILGDGAGEPKPGMTVSRREFRQARADFVATVNDAGLRASVFYSGAGHRLLNEALRENRVDQDPDLAKMVRDLDRVVDSHAMPVDTYVARSMRGAWAERFAALLQPGDVFEEPGYTSTSAVSPLPGSVKLRIKVPVGAKAAPLPSGHPEEEEFLLPRGSRFRVVSVSRTAKGTNMELELVAAGDTVQR